MISYLSILKYFEHPLENLLAYLLVSIEKNYKTLMGQVLIIQNLKTYLDAGNYHLSSQSLNPKPTSCNLQLSISLHSSISSQFTNEFYVLCLNIISYIIIRTICTHMGLKYPKKKVTMVKKLKVVNFFNRPPLYTR